MRVRDNIDEEIEHARSLTPEQRLLLVRDLSDRALAGRSEPVDRVAGLREKAKLGRRGRLLKR